MGYFAKLRKEKTSLFYQKMWEEISAIKVFDTHEHLTPPELLTNEFQTAKCYTPIIFGGSYLYRLEQKPNIPQWLEKVEEYKGTAYLRSMLWAIDELYGIEPPVNRTYIEKLENALKTAYSSNPIYHIKEVLEQKMHADGVVLNIELDSHIQMQEKIPCLLAAAGIPNILDGYFVPSSGKSGHLVYKFAEDHLHMNIKDIKTLQDYCIVVRKLLTYFRDSNKYICFKIQSAYSRPISFPEPDENDLKIPFNKPLNSEQQLWQFGDYMMHFVLDWAAENWRVPFQFHTGLARMYDGGSNALNLSYLFQKYADMHFDLFHGNYPYNNLAGMLHQIRNISADLCWLPIISPSAAIRNLIELMEVGDMVDASYHSPRLRTSAFGGDCRVVEGSYGALLTAKDVVIRALEDMFNRGLILTEGDAVDLAEQVLYRNPKRIFTNNL